MTCMKSKSWDGPQAESQSSSIKCSPLAPWDSGTNSAFGRFGVPPYLPFLWSLLCTQPSPRPALSPSRSKGQGDLRKSCFLTEDNGGKAGWVDVSSADLGQADKRCAWGMLGWSLPEAVTPRGMQLCGQVETGGSDLKARVCEGHGERSMGGRAWGQTIHSEGMT